MTLEGALDALVAVGAAAGLAADAVRGEGADLAAAVAESAPRAAPDWGVQVGGADGGEDGERTVERAGRCGWSGHGAGCGGGVIWPISSSPPPDDAPNFSARNRPCATRAAASARFTASST